MNAIKLPRASSNNKPIVHCNYCRAQLWFKGGQFINDGVWCIKCAYWNKHREMLEEKK